ncbi:MAG: NAD-dependent epimerase/dehydratase family protein [Gemmatimonadales bacterium]
MSGEWAEVTDEAALEELLSRPAAAVVPAMRELDGDLLVLGAGGKMGPSLARMAKRAWEAAGVTRRVIAVARFSDAAIRTSLENVGVETIRCDLLDRAQVARLPDAPNVVFMAGQKFGTTGEEGRTWAVNTYLPGIVAERFARSRIVAFSTGNVYPLWPAESEGPSETDATGPIGEYAQSALGRERVLEYFSRRNDTPMAVLRLNYAIEPRYGVLRDIADRVKAQLPVDLAMGRVNLIWQGDANAIALRAFSRCTVSPAVLNVTGRPAHAVRGLAEGFGRRFGVNVSFRGTEATTALLSNAARMEALFGRPEVGIEEMIERVAAWVERGGRSLGKPTHFEEREGRF